MESVCCLGKTNEEWPFLKTDLIFWVEGKGEMTRFFCTLFSVVNSRSTQEACRPFTMCMSCVHAHLDI